MALSNVAVCQSDEKSCDGLDQVDLIGRTIDSGLPLLTFPQKLEARFLKSGEARRFSLMVVAGWASIFLFAGMVIADHLMMPSVLRLGLGLRGLLYPSFIVAGLSVLRRLRLPGVNEWAIATTGLLAALMEGCIISKGTGPWAVARVVELNMIIVYTCALARFWPAVVFACSVGVIHGYLVATMPDGSGIMASNATLLMATSTAFALYGTYKLEHDERMAFLLRAREEALNAELTLAHERLTRMATTDTLTNVANRRYFEGFLQECWQHAQAQQRPLSLILLDVDDFKGYNDRYGHQAGDRCLCAVAQALTDSIRRPGDLVARWGGEEFAIVMMDADADAAMAAGERVRSAVEGLHVAHEASRVAAHVTVSLGVATRVPNGAEGDAWEDLIQRADDALYRAKAAGRNRVHGAGDMVSSAPRLERA